MLGKSERIFCTVCLDSLYTSAIVPKQRIRNAAVSIHVMPIKSRTVMFSATPVVLTTNAKLVPKAAVDSTYYTYCNIKIGIIPFC